MFMPGVPKPVYILLTPIELATYFVVRPLTLSLPIICQYVCWPLAVAGFYLGGDHLLKGVIGLKLSFPVCLCLWHWPDLFEFMVQCLQAYIFTLLTALYIAGALADEH
jgi:F-type H+-transporting ATPase subunit a